VIEKKGYFDLQNQYGDYEGHKGKTNIYQYDSKTQKKENGELQQEAIRLIQTFEKQLKQKKSSLHIAFPACADSYAATFDMDNLVKELKQFSVLGTPTTFTYPDSCFYD